MISLEDVMPAFCKTNIESSSRWFYRIWQNALVKSISWKILASCMVLIANKMMTLARENCFYNVPWIKGRPTDIFFLDDDEDLKRAGITLHKKLRRTDYYLHWNSREWALVEKKNGPSRIDTAIEQLQSTLEQLRVQGKYVNRLIVVATKFSQNEKAVYGRAASNNHLLYLRKSSNRNSLPVSGINLEFYTFDELNRLREQRRLE